MSSRAGVRIEGAGPNGAASAGASVQVNGLGKCFGEHWAIQDVNLTVDPGEFFSIIGPSGCGKTTTLRLLAGLEEATTGEIWIGGKEVSRTPAFRRPVNTVFQHYALFPHLSVYQNIAFGLRERKLGKSEIERRVRSAVDLVQLSSRVTARPKQLSGGQQQRVALARALVLEPQVLLLDEPLGALDFKLRREMQTALREVQHRIGRAFIYVTHDQEEAFSMSDRVAVMDEGRVAQIGSPREVYERPESLYVARFVGAPNTIPATIAHVESEGFYVVAVPGFEPIRCHGITGLARGNEVVVIARPEAATALPADDDLRLSGVVRGVAFLGPQTNYVLDIQPVGTIHIQAPAAGLPQSPGIGDQARIGWPLERLWVVPRDSTT